MTSDPANDDKRDMPQLRIDMLDGGGIVVWIGAELFAAFSTVAELCVWLREHLKDWDQRSAAPEDAAEDMPQVIQRMGARRDKRRGGFFSRSE